MPTGAWPRVGFRSRAWLPADLDISVSVGWNRGHLLRPSGSTWPYVGLHVPAGHMAPDERAALRAALRPTAVRLGWTLSEQGWPWWANAAPEPGELDLPAYAQPCLTQLLNARRHGPCRGRRPDP